MILCTFLTCYKQLVSLNVQYQFSVAKAPKGNRLILPCTNSWAVVDGINCWYILAVFFFFCHFLCSCESEVWLENRHFQQCRSRKYQNAILLINIQQVPLSCSVWGWDEKEQRMAASDSWLHMWLEKIEPSTWTMKGFCNGYFIIWQFNKG